MEHFIKTLFILLFGFVSIHVNAQDPQFSQFYAAPLYMGPSFAGMTNGSRITLNYRKQWPVITNGFNTYAFGIDHNFVTIKSGLGLVAIRDDIGSGHLSYTSLGAIYAYRIRVDNNWYVRPGLTFWYTRRSLDFYKLLFPDQVGNSTATIETPTQKYKAHIDFSSSVITYTRKVWLGLTVDHLMRPNQALGGSSNRISYKWSVYAGTKFPVRSRMKALKAGDESLTTALLYKRQGDWQQLDFGTYWNKPPLILGVWWRGIPLFGKNPGMDAIVFLAGIKYLDYTFAYSYDITISELGVYTGGTHEISFTYLFNNKFKIKHKKGAMPCPSF